ncbi:MAG: 2-amino-4-hydroxy-6-hydroxymethyldihydropteridine diphosphokinase [Halothiobacillaceae bacterium]
MTCPVECVVGVGANLGDPVAQVHQAVEALARLPDTEVLASSALYLNPPVGPPEQPDYVNAVVRLATRLGAPELLDALQALEQAAGRVRRRSWDARSLDLDLLVFGDLQMDDPRLTLPHPQIARRRFVLVPWLEVDPEASLPDGRLVAELLRTAPPHPLQRLDAPGTHDAREDA